MIKYIPANNNTYTSYNTSSQGPIFIQILENDYNNIFIIRIIIIIIIIIITERTNNTKTII